MEKKRTDQQWATLARQTLAYMGCDDDDEDYDYDQMIKLEQLHRGDLSIHPNIGGNRQKTKALYYTRIDTSY